MYKVSVWKPCTTTVLHLTAIILTKDTKSKCLMHIWCRLNGIHPSLELFIFTSYFMYGMYFHIHVFDIQYFFNTWDSSQYKSLSRYGISILKIRPSHDHLMCIVGILYWQDDIFILTTRGHPSCFVWLTQCHALLCFVLSCIVFCEH